MNRNGTLDEQSDGTNQCAPLSRHPLASEANRTDMQKLADLLDARLMLAPDLPADAPEDERPYLTLNRGYDYDAWRDTTRAHGYMPHIPRRASKDRPLPPPTDSQRHPARRWVVELAHAWFNRFRALHIRWAKKAENYLALLDLAAVLLIERKLRYARSFPG